MADPMPLTYEEAQAIADIADGTNVSVLRVEIGDIAILEVTRPEDGLVVTIDPDGLIHTMTPSKHPPRLIAKDSTNA